MSKKIIAITSCPTGVAHTYMAAENLERAAQELGVEIKVETHGAIGVENKLTARDVEEAEGLIIAADTEIEKSRFGGKQVIEVSVREGIDHPDELIKQILNHQGRVLSGRQAAADVEEESTQQANLWRSLMNGVSHMIPFVVTGGLLIAIALTVGGTPTPEGLVVEPDTFWGSVLSIGEAAMGFMVPVLSAYIAYSIADRPGLAPGMVGGFIAANGSFYGSEAGAGFIGGIISGFLAGFIAQFIRKIKVPKAVQSIMPIIIVPIFSSLIVGLIFIYLIGMPIATLFAGLTNWLASMQGASSVVLAMIIGAMIAFDMGGPFNKVAFMSGSGLIAEGSFAVMGAVAVAVSVPPLALGVASHLFPKKFTEQDKEAGKAAFAMGFFGITEGAIPFAAQDPFRVIPSIMIGSMAGSVVAMLGGVGGHVAHGGPIVALLGAIDHVPTYFIALTVGVAVSVLCLRILKPDLETVDAVSEETVIETETDSASTVDSSAGETASSLNLMDLMTPELITLDLAGDHRDTVIPELLANPALSDRLTSKTDVEAALFAREEESSTGIGDGVAIPHAQDEAIKEATVLFGRSAEGAEWESLDGEPAHFIFMILVPAEQAGDTHLKILQMLARRLMDQGFKEKLQEAATKEEVMELLATIHE